MVGSQERTVSFPCHHGYIGVYFGRDVKFRYTVSSDDSAPDVIAVPRNGLSFNRGVIQDDYLYPGRYNGLPFTNAAILDHPALAADGDHMVRIGSKPVEPNTPTTTPRQPPRLPQRQHRRLPRLPRQRLQRHQHPQQLLLPRQPPLRHLRRLQQPPQQPPQQQRLLRLRRLQQRLQQRLRPRLLRQQLQLRLCVGGGVPAGPVRENRRTRPGSPAGGRSRPSRCPPPGRPRRRRGGPAEACTAVGTPPTRPAPGTRAGSAPGSRAAPPG